MKVFIASAANKEISEDYVDLAYDVSNVFAEKGFDLLFGAANYSMMGACYKAFIKNNRKVYAYTVPKYERDFKRLPKAKCVRVEDTLLRFRKLYFRSDVIVILPGGVGTVAELFSSIEEYRTSLGNKKILLVNYKNYYDELIDWFKSSSKKGFVSKDIFQMFNIAENISDVEKIINDYLESK